MVEWIVVPEERIGAIIGKEGETKRLLEKAGSCKIEMDSGTGECSVLGKEPLLERKAASAVKAVARGFSPEKAFFLFRDDYFLRVFSLKEALGKSERKIRTKKARVIGSQGSVRERIEKETQCFVSVYGNTIALIGKLEDLEVAEKVVEKIIQGAGIPTVFDQLEEAKLKEQAFEL